MSGCQHIFTANHSLGILSSGSKNFPTGYLSQILGSFGHCFDISSDIKEGNMTVKTYILSNPFVLTGFYPRLHFYSYCISPAKQSGGHDQKSLVSSPSKSSLTVRDLDFRKFSSVFHTRLLSECRTGTRQESSHCRDCQQI